MLVPVKFILDNVREKRIEELRFYLAARSSGMNHAGYFKNISGFTGIAKKSLTKKLVKMEWFGGRPAAIRVISVYKLEDHPVCASCDPEVLKSKSKFKGWILAVAESYVARNNFRINKGWKKEIDYSSKTFVRKQLVTGVRKFNDGSYATEIANSFISTLLGVSTRTVSRWRKNSTNQYKLTKILGESKYCFEEGKCFFDEKTKMFAQWSLEIITTTFIYFSGEKHLNSSILEPALSCT